ncbi:hypothetical protein [Streptomyces thermoalcalitolerans]
MLDAMGVGPVHAAAGLVKLLVQQLDHGAEQVFVARCDTITRFLSALLKTFAFKATPAHGRCCT